MDGMQFLLGGSVSAGDAITDQSVRVALVVGVVTCGVMTGLLFAFSGSVLAGMNTIAPAHSIRAMQTMNTALLNPFFGLAFFGSTLSAAYLGVRALLRDPSPSRTLLLVGAAFFVIGVFLVTITVNVPMNNRLQRFDGDQLRAAEEWRRFSGRWLLVNHLRTLDGAIATIAFSLALLRA